MKLSIGVNMAKFCVYDNGKPAILHTVGWLNNEFATFEEALTYALHWLGKWAPSPEVLKVNVPYSYSGYGDTVEIRDTMHQAFH